ncbi:MAG: sodium:proton antiporter [Alphaproteobacteria bacterium]|nr:sodium:proton antiporter [Alphaproteobacteria bacterium]
MHQSRPRRPRAALLAIVLCLATPAAMAAELDGARLGFAWAIPFIGVLLSIAILPLAAPQLWHHHFGKITAAWSLAFVLPYAAMDGLGATAAQLVHVLVGEYVPFIILIGSLFVIAGGVYLRGNLHGSPAMNTVLLAAGTGIASITGTTGAAMLLVRAVIRANDERIHNAHVMVFFIFLVANIGGSLTPLGDPPLFLGFLKGVGFFWPTVHLLLPMLMVSVIVLAAFYAIDSHFYARDAAFKARRDPTPDTPKGLSIEGGVNIWLLLGVMVAVLASGIWKPGISWNLLGTEVPLQGILRDIVLVGLAWSSLRLTPASCREANAFTWGPILEVAKLFAGIFVTIVPVIAMLKAGDKGAFSGLVQLASRPDGSPANVAYFWLTGVLSSFLDNAPTYLVFFNMAGGDPDTLMGPLATTLAAISAGAVFMGANTYIGNAPNFMVKAVAEENGVRMPSFFGYMVWSCAILIPCFLLVTVVFFR